MSWKGKFHYNFPNSNFQKLQLQIRKIKESDIDPHLIFHTPSLLAHRELAGEESYEKLKISKKCISEFTPDW
jgi:hypothetical protein